MDWGSLLARGGDFRDVTDGRFIASYLGIPAIRLQIIDCIRRRGIVTRPELARELGWTSGGLRSHLEVLQELGLLESERIRVPDSFKPVTAYRLDEMRLTTIATLVRTALCDLPEHAAV